MSTVLPTSEEYELLVKWLAEQLAGRAEVLTSRVVRDCQVQGRATGNQIDVLWDFTDAAGQDYRIVFEARSYKNSIKQGALHAFRSVVDDIQDQARPVTGVMVTTTGYQQGAQKVASTYGLLILELRQPTAADTQNRTIKIVLNMTPNMALIRNVNFEVVEVYDQSSQGSIEALEWITVGSSDRDAEDARDLKEILTEGELGGPDELRPVHPVRREFDPPQLLRISGRQVALLGAVTADVGDFQGRPTRITVGGLENVAWMLRNSLTGAKAWFAQDGRVWTTDSLSRADPGRPGAGSGRGSPRHPDLAGNCPVPLDPSHG